MRRVPVFTDWLYEFDCPPDTLSLALHTAKNATHHRGETNRTSYPEQFFGDDFDPVREWVDSCLEQVRTDLKLECEHLLSSVCWTTLTERGRWHHTHKHGVSFASGVLYLTESGAQTWFSRESVWNPELTLINVHNSETSTLLYKKTTDPGRLVVFPSGLYHSVSEHDRDDPRYILSFNSFPSGQLGTYSETYSRRLLNLTVNQKK